ncbi:tyrosine-type recombinase/integrase [Demequina flava]|uniref:tyrosine-type recombinase/integrase n=1 Tax=Demequina flava TaxID=1095025 RepID=UPI0009E19F8B|nr:site-specific integrase [Demequina flava]
MSSVQIQGGTVKVARKLPPGITLAASGKYRARYRDANGKEHTRHFDVLKTTKKKSGAVDWLETQKSKVRTGTHVDPAATRITVAAWCDQWIEGYGVNRPSTVRQAQVHIKHIVEAFGGQRIGDVKPSQVKSWVAKLKRDGYADSTVYAVHSRLSQIMSDAVHDGVITRNPCSRRTSPKAGAQRPYVATTAQVWDLHDAMPEQLRPAILLGAFAGLRIAETCGLRNSDVDFMRGVISPAVQYPEQALKSEMSMTAIPIAPDMALELSRYATGEKWLLEDILGQQVKPFQIERAVRVARGPAGLPDTFRFHDLRHYYASLLISEGCDVKIVQARLRHAQATTTLNTYAHLWPDTEESTRAAISRIFAARADSLRTESVSI